MVKLTFPRHWVFITRPYSSAHPAIDMGWGDTVGGPNADMYAPADGVVTIIQDGYGNDKSKGYGNYIKIEHGGGVSTILAHCLKGAFKVKKGDKVKRGQAVCKMGNSGNSNGCHVHYCVLINDVRKDPLLYTYLDTAWQTVYPKTDAAYKIMRYSVNPAEKYLAKRDDGKNQLYVTAADLRARKAPGLNGDIYGWMPKGYYSVLATSRKDGYTWCKLADNLFAAVTDGYSEYLPKIDARDEKMKAMSAALTKIEQVARQATE